MSAKRKKELRWALKRTNELLARNADPCETFEGVLNRSDVRALKAVVGFAERALTFRRVNRGQGFTIVPRPLP